MALSRNCKSTVNPANCGCVNNCLSSQLTISNSTFNVSPPPPSKRGHYEPCSPQLLNLVFDNPAIHTTHPAIRIHLHIFLFKLTPVPSPNPSLWPRQIPVKTTTPLVVLLNNHHPASLNVVVPPSSPSQRKSTYSATIPPAPKSSTLKTPNTQDLNRWNKYPIQPILPPPPQP